MVASPGQLERVDVDVGEEPFFVFLKAQGALPFTPESVAAYKAMQVARAKPKLWQRWSFMRPVNDFLNRSFPLTFLTAFGSMICLVGLPLSSRPYWTMVVPALIFILSAVGTALTFRLDGSLVFDDATWVKVPIEAYVGDVSETHRRLAREISWRFGCEVFVDQLVQQTRVLDPFLVVRYQGEDYDIAVWDETDFNGDRTS